jgi:protein MpaA
VNFVPLKSGKTVEGADIEAFCNEVKGQKYVYLLAGVHGDEVEGVYCLEQLFKWLKQVENIEYPIIVIPLLNVDGYRTGTRLNSHGVDLNRNLPSACWALEFTEGKYNPGPKPFSEPENLFLKKLFEKYTPSIMISFHSWKPMINFNGSCKGLAEFIATYNSYPVKSDVGHPTPGSLGNYLPQAYSAPVITLEFPVLEGETMMLKDIWKENETAMREMILSLDNFIS